MTEIRRTILTPGTVHLRAQEGETPCRTITGYAILFSSPSAPLWTEGDRPVREMIAPEAVDMALLDKSDIKFTMYHDGGLILGRSRQGAGTLKYFTDTRGVGFELDLPRSPNGDEALELVRRGDLSGCSFAFTTRYFDPDCVERAETEDGILYTVRKITGIYDFTLAADPAYPETSVEARSLQEALSQFRQEPKPSPEKVRAQVRQMREAINQNSKLIP